MPKLSEITRGGDRPLRLSDLRAMVAPKTPEEVEAELQRLIPGVSMDPTQGMSNFEKTFAGVGSSIAQTGRGLGQLVGAVSQEEVDMAAQDEAALLDTKAGFIGNIGGHIGQLLIPAGYAVKAGSAAPRLAMAGRVVLNPRAISSAAGAKGVLSGIGAAGAIGGLQAGIQPVVGDETRLGNAALGAAFGAGGQVVGEAIGAVARPIVRALGVGRQSEATAAAALRASASDPASIAALEAGRVGGQIVPGAVRTTAEVTRDKGLAALERVNRSKPGTAAVFSDIDEARNAARVGLVRSEFNGASRESAEALRNSVAQAQGPAIREATKQTGAESLRVASSIDRLLKSPRFRNVPAVQEKLSTFRGMLTQEIDDAGRISAARGVANDALANAGRMSSKDFDSVREAVRLVRGAAQRGEGSEQVLAQIKKLKPASSKAQVHLANMMRSLRTAEKGKPDVASLYNARKYATNTLMKGADAEVMTALRSTIGRLDDEIAAVAPTYKQYLKDYSQGMRQADQAEVGARLLATGRARPSDQAIGVQLGANTVQATRNLDQLVRGATGFQRGTAASTLTPQQIAAAQAVARDIDSQGWVQSQSRALQGQSITGELAEGNNRLGSMAAGVLADAIPGGNTGLMAADAILAQVGKRNGARVQGLVAEALASPDRARQILAVLPVDVRADVVRQLGPVGEARGITLASMGLGGALAAPAMDIGNVSGYDRNDPRYRGD